VTEKQLHTRGSELSHLPEDYTLMVTKFTGISSVTNDCMSASNAKQCHTIFNSQCFEQK
jgi:hypothetical protein